MFWPRSSKPDLPSEYLDARYCEWLYQSAVVLLALDKRHRGGVADTRIPSPGGGEPCAKYPYTTCEIHKGVHDHLEENLGLKRVGRFQILLFSPQEERLLESQKDEDVGGKFGRKQFDRAAFDGDVLERAQRMIGPPLRPYDVSPFSSGFKAEVLALRASGRKARLKTFRDLVKKFESLPKRAPEELRATVSSWLLWRCQERLAFILDQIKDARSRRQRSKAYDSLESVVRGHSLLREQVQSARGSE